MSGANFSTVTLLIGAADRGDRSAADALFSTLYSELHRLAKRELARQSLPVTLSATTLLHQAYLGMAEREGTSFPDRARFMGYAARVMRGLIIDHARNRQAQEARWSIRDYFTRHATTRTAALITRSSRASVRRSKSLLGWTLLSPRLWT